VSDLTRHMDDYLRLRRALGFKLKREGRELPQLVAYVEAAGATTLSIDLSVAWARLPQGVQPLYRANRLGSARGFARYLQTIDATTQVPPCGIWSSPRTRPVPYLYSDQDVERLLVASRQLRPPLRAATYETLFGLIAVSGMRIGEARRLQRNDVDLTKGVLTIREAKFDRSRLVPLHASATDALRSYAVVRDQHFPSPTAKTFFVSTVGMGLHYSGVHATFKTLCASADLGSPAARPRIHDLRHSFAVRTLIELTRSGIDIHAHIAALSIYLGHVNPAGTYWYLSAAPELMELAAGHLNRRIGGRP